MLIRLITFEITLRPNFRELCVTDKQVDNRVPDLLVRWNCWNRADLKNNFFHSDQLLRQLIILEIFRFIFFFFFVFFPPRILNVIVRHSKDNFYRIISYIRFLILIFFLLYWTWQKCESPLLDYPLISLKRRGKFRKSLSRLTLIQEHLDGGWWNLTRLLCKCTEDLHQPRSSLNDLLEPVSFGSREFDILIRHLKKKISEWLL